MPQSQVVFNIIQLWSNFQVKSTLKVHFDPPNDFVSWALFPFYRWAEQNLDRLNDAASQLSGL